MEKLNKDENLGVTKKEIQILSSKSLMAISIRQFKSNTQMLCTDLHDQFRQIFRKICPVVTKEKNL